MSISGVNNHTLLGWDVEETVAAFASAAITVSGSSSTVSVDGVGNTTTTAYSFSFNETYVRTAFRWAEAEYVDGFDWTGEDDHEFYVMRWNGGSGSLYPLEALFGDTGDRTLVFTSMTSGSAGVGIALSCIFQAFGTATETVTIHYADGTTPDDVTTTDYFVNGSATLARGGGTGQFNLEMSGHMPGTGGLLTENLTNGDIDFQTLDGILARGGTHTWDFNEAPDESYTTYANSYTITLTLA